MTELYTQQFNDFLDSTDEARRSSERVRDYLDHKQWTSNEAKILKGRKQAPIVVNLMRRKHDTLLGVERQSRQDPKALPRTPKHEQDADAATEALRYVVDNVDFDQVSSDVFDEYMAEGYGGCIVEVEKVGDTFEISLKVTHWDRIYYDPHSRKRDFKDASFIGVSAWFYTNEVKRMFDGKDDEIDQLGAEHRPDETYEDRPRWLDRTKKDKTRVRVNEHYFLKDGVWHQVFYTKDLVLREEQESPFLDENGEPSCPIELVSAYVDRDNNRYGLGKGMIPLQDEVNHRRSKALHMLSNVRVVRGKGVVESGTRVLDQLASGRADIELADPNGRFEILPNDDFAQGQLALLQEAKAELDDYGPNETLAGKEDRVLSGRALLQKQQAGITELQGLMDGHRHWKVRVYRQIWNRIKQFWDEERWIRVTDNPDNVRFVGLNREVTLRDQIAQQLGVGSDEVDGVLEEQGAEPIMDLETGTGEMENVLAEMDVDIILHESPDIALLQQEQFELVANLAGQRGDIPTDAVIRLSSISNKDEVLEAIQGTEEQRKAAAQQQQQVQQGLVEQEQQTAQADVAAKLAKARRDNAEADGQLIENSQMQLGI